MRKRWIRRRILNAERFLAYTTATLLGIEEMRKVPAGVSTEAMEFLDHLYVELRRDNAKAAGKLTHLQNRLADLEVTPWE